MKSAQEVLKSREEKRQQKLKENQEQINKELLAFEKALNKYENNVLDEKPYVTVDEIIRSKEVKTLLEQQGYIIDRISGDIKVNTTRIYLDKTNYDIATRRNINSITDISQTQKDFEKEYNCKWGNNKENNSNYNTYNITVDENLSKDTLDEIVKKLGQVMTLDRSNRNSRRYC